MAIQFSVCLSSNAVVGEVAVLNSILFFFLYDYFMYKVIINIDNVNGI